MVTGSWSRAAGDLQVDGRLVVLPVQVLVDEEVSNRRVILMGNTTALGLTALWWIHSGRSLHLDKVSVAPSFFMPSNSSTFSVPTWMGPILIGLWAMTSSSVPMLAVFIPARQLAMSPSPIQANDPRFCCKICMTTP